MIRSCRMKRRLIRICTAKPRTKRRETPWKLLFLMNSYRLMDNSSKQMQRWLRK